MKKSFAVLLLFSILVTIGWTVPGKDKSAMYQLTIYQYKDSLQEKVLDNYLEKALVPALHRMKYGSVGVFKDRANDTAMVKKLYVLLPGKSLDELNGIEARMARDSAFLEKGKTFLDAPYSNPPFLRLERLYLKAFALAPELALPVLYGPKAERVYELRSYESATGKIFRNKVQMFNEGGEIALFKRLNFNAVFYSEVVAGSRMPNLMYMTCFENMADRDEHWKKFGNDPEWKRMSSLPEYQHNVSMIEKSFLRPVDYSDY
ncbi:MAG: NIPSNAP family protein [Chitinophagales bacterium]|nr:NIPSNAP family protein [Chitinophagales bacterium]